MGLNPAWQREYLMVAQMEPFFSVNKMYAAEK